MTNEKFISEIKTLKKFFTLHCKDKHTHQKKYTKNIYYKNQNYTIDFCLCHECSELISYSIQRLQECPHELKPRCRNCSNPCYEKTQWKQLAHLMRYSGIQLGVLKIKKLYKFSYNLFRN